MDFREKNPNKPPPADPSEESSLYTWANLHGTKHRDFSLLHRDSRTPPRHSTPGPEEERLVVTSAAVRALDIDARENVLFRPSRESDNPPRVDGLERRKGVRRVEDAIIAETRARKETTDPAKRQTARDVEFDLRRREAILPRASRSSVEEIAGTDRLVNETGTDSEASSLPELHREECLDGEVVDPLADTLSSPVFLHPGSTGPAWLYTPPDSPIPAQPLGTVPNSPSVSVAETLQSSRERVASRWFALKGVFEQDEVAAAGASLRQKETRPPVLAVYSLAGGVGKTSLVATVGRALSAMGEKVLLTDTAPHGLLPFYFGAHELQADTVRTFSPPSGSTDAPVYLVSHDLAEKEREEIGQQSFIEEVIANSQGMHRILLDLPSSSNWVIRQMARFDLTVLIPVAPDMNSVLSLSSVEAFFGELVDTEARPLQPFFLLNQFDPSLPLHLDVREVLRKKLGDRLLPFVIRRAPEVSEALAEGMTVMDYLPDASIVEDYINVATWIRNVAAPATAGFRNARWTER